MGRYPAPVVAAIGCGDQPPAGPPVFAAFFGEFHCIPLQKKNTRQFVVMLQSTVSKRLYNVVINYLWIYHYHPNKYSF